MINFRIGTQIEKELEDFRNAKIQLASLDPHNNTVRFGNAQPEGYYFNQRDAIALIDLYYNSKFEGGPKDPAGQRKIFLNVGKFRSELSSKEIDIDVKDGRFIPDDYADPWVAIFLQKEFKEWAKENKFGAEINKYVEAFPKYGSVVGKKVGNEIKFVPLQNLKNEQTADTLQTAKYVIEEHPAMTPWEIDQMPNWSTDGLNMRFDQVIDVHERYGFVPLKWLKEANGEDAADGDENIYVDSLVIAGRPPSSTKPNEPWHVFYAGKITARPYREAHWAKQHGRWLGMGVMEDLVENQEAKNIIVNLILKGLRWYSKIVGQSTNTDMTMKNLATEVKDGEILEVGPQGEIRILDFAQKTPGEFAQFLNEFENNSNQKSFQFTTPSGTPYRLGLLFYQESQTFFGNKRDRLALFLQDVVEDFLVPQFMKDMQNSDKVLAMFSGENGFKILQDAAKDYVRNEATRISILSGKPVDAAAIEQLVQPFQEVQTLFFQRDAKFYGEVKFRYTFQFTNETEDVSGDIKNLSQLYQLLAGQGDPRAEQVLERISAISGQPLSQFGAETLAGKNPGGAAAPEPADKNLALPPTSGAPLPNAVPVAANAR